jgi:hypothetical protein
MIAIHVSNFFSNFFYELFALVTFRFGIFQSYLFSNVTFEVTFRSYLSKLFFEVFRTYFRSLSKLYFGGFSTLNFELISVNSTVTDLPPAPLEFDFDFEENLFLIESQNGMATSDLTAPQNYATLHDLNSGAEDPEPSGDQAEGEGDTLVDGKWGPDAHRICMNFPDVKFLTRGKETRTLG